MKKKMLDNVKKMVVLTIALSMVGNSAVYASELDNSSAYVQESNQVSETVLEETETVLEETETIAEETEAAVEETETIAEETETAVEETETIAEETETATEEIETIAEETETAVEETETVVEESLLETDESEVMPLSADVQEGWVQEGNDWFYYQDGEKLVDTDFSVYDPDSGEYYIYRVDAEEKGLYHGIRMTKMTIGIIMPMTDVPYPV